MELGKVGRSPRTSFQVSDWRKLSEDHLPGYDPWSTAGPGDRFDADSANRAVVFFPGYFSHVKGVCSGNEFILSPWQQAVVGNLFGWLREDGTRRYRRCLIYVPRKNGKTVLTAGLALYMLFGDGEPGAEIYTAAAERDQANLLFDQAKRMVLNSPNLSKVAEVWTKSIVVKGTISSFKSISAEASSKHGYNAHCAIVDELHAQRDEELVDVLETSMGSRRQPLMIYLTTADFDRPSICNEVYHYAKSVIDGRVSDHEFLPVVYEAPTDADWREPSTWQVANPNLGVSVHEEFLRAQCEKAKAIRRFQNTFKRLYLNIRTGARDVWIDLEEWDACKRGELEFPSPKRLPQSRFEDFLRGRECYAGLDLSSTRDLSSCVLVFPDEKGFYCLPYFWVPRDMATKRMRATVGKREPGDQVDYTQWASSGHLTITSGSAVDYELILREIKKLADKYSIREIAADPWNAEHVLQRLAADGFRVCKFRQGFASMNLPSKELEKLIAARKLAHNGHPVLRWMAGNVLAAEDPAGNLKPDKSRSRDKIDGIVALLMGIGRAVFATDETSVYEGRGLVTL